jgi:PAS domain S-box-containing protein
MPMREKGENSPQDLQDAGLTSSAASDPSLRKSLLPKGTILVFGLVMVCLLAVGVWFYDIQERHIRRDIEADLSAIAQLKVEQIVNWRGERLADGRVLQESPFFIEEVARWLKTPQPETTEQILDRFRSLQANYGYYDVLLVDDSGKVRLNLGAPLASLHEDAARALATAFREKRAALSDLHAGPGDLPPHICVIAPLFSGEGEKAQPVGAVILQCVACQFLFPLIGSWPVGSRSAETLLLRRENDSVVILNELRHRQDTALKLRFSLSDKEKLALIAAQGTRGLVYGKDYRGVEVLAIYRPIPDSPWFMAAKIDKTEALATWRFRSILILALIFGLIAATAAGAGMVWQREQKKHYATLFEAEAALGKSEERYRMTLLSVGDGVITTDKEGRVELMNPVAERLTGWKQEEAFGRPVEEVFHIVNEETRQEVENPVRRVVREGVIIGLANHSLLVGRDGCEYAVADCGSPICNEAGETTGVVLVFQDQTAERATMKAFRESKEALRESEEKYRNLVERANDGIAFIQNGIVMYANPRLAEIWGGVTDEVIGTPFADYLSPECVSEVVDRYKRRMSGEDVPAMFEITFMRKDGSRMDAEVNANVVMHKGEPTDLVFIRDITERKRAEEALRKEQTLLRTLINALPDYVFVKDSESRFVTANMAHLEAMGAASLDSVIGKSDFDLFPKELAETYYADERQVIQNDRPLLNREERVVEHSGVEKWVLTTKMPMHDDHGHVVGVVGISRDITDRKRADEALSQTNRNLQKTLLELEQSRNMLQSIIESIPVRVFWKDKDLHFLGCNTAFAQDAGLGDPQELLGKDDFAMAWREQAEIYRADDKKVMESGQPKMHIIEPQTTPAGTTIWLSTSKVPLQMPNGDIVGILGVYEDITARKEDEDALRRALKEREVMLREIHHRVKNNIQIISSLLRLQSRSVRDESVLEVLNESQNRIRSMALIHEKLYQSQDFAHIDFSDYLGKMTNHLLAVYRVDSERIQLRVEAKNIQLDVSRAIPCGLIINELVTNALKHAFPGDREGKILVRMDQKDEDKFELVVKDTGVGLPEGFDLSKAETLGFQIVRDLVKQLSGSIEVRKGDGMEIVIRF